MRGGWLTLCHNPWQAVATRPAHFPLAGRRPGHRAVQTMGYGSSQDEPAARTAAQFATTHWSTVLRAADSASAESNEALERLCRTYWFPLYAFARRQGRDAEDAKDLTQAFFAHLFEGGFFARAAPERGKFRSFLLGAFKRFMRDQNRACHAQQRGGQFEFVTLDNELAEERWSAESLADRKSVG